MAASLRLRNIAAPFAISSGVGMYAPLSHLLLPVVFVVMASCYVVCKSNNLK
jgi:hypothetical protein